MIPLSRGPGFEIYQGTAQEVLPSLAQRFKESTEPVHYVTDPPYGIGLDYGKTVDSWRPNAEFWAMLYDLVPEGSTLHMTVSNRHLDWWLEEVGRGGWEYMHTSVYWNIGRAGGNANGQFAYAWEPLLSFRMSDDTFRLRKRMLSDVFGHNGRRETNHPAERDLGCWRSFVDLLPEGLIVDPFMGSGTTLRACLDVGRYAIGIEREATWCFDATMRCLQQSLFTEGEVSTIVQPTLEMR